MSDYNFLIRFLYQMFHTTNYLGINSSQEKLQHVLRDLLIDIDHVTNISDVIFNYVKNEIEQDKNIKTTYKILEI